MEIDDLTKSRNDRKATTMKSVGGTMHTKVKMYRLEFSKNWYIVGKSYGKGVDKGNKGDDDGTANAPVFRLVSYRGNILQVN